MASTDPANLEAPAHVQAELSKLFGSFKAEWLKDDIFELFTEPAYFPELTTRRSCILIGGRGTGKTTVLRGLSYQGQAALAHRFNRPVFTQQFIGLYYRVNTNHVTAFEGPELDERGWRRLFAHYVNLLLTDLVLEFLDWVTVNTCVGVDLPPEGWTTLATTLNVPAATSLRHMRAILTTARHEFEAYINNVRDATQPRLSLQGTPLDSLTASLLTLPALAGKHFFFLIDEYENLLDYQQQVFNTLIKQAAQSYTFKVGVRELGWRCRTTLNVNEQLIHPADYVRIHIAETLDAETFNKFALDVCQGRLSKLNAPMSQPGTDVRVMLPGLSEEEESQRLGVQEAVDALSAHLQPSANPDELATYQRMSDLERYFVAYVSRSQSELPLAVLRSAHRDPLKWRERFDNYKHSLLFTIRKGKRGPRKYYSGWSIITQLASGNIRYLLELVVQSLLEHIHAGSPIGTPVDPLLQTKAAQAIGGKYVSELEGLSVHGAQLTKLLLALGRIFGRMAADPEGHTPEVNQFRVADRDEIELESELVSKVDAVLNAAVMHLALVRFPGNKLGDLGDTKDYTYMMHPIFAPFFEFSHRQKRHMTITRLQLLELILKPKPTIRAILAAQNRQVDDQLPEQLLLFESFYHGSP